MQNATQLVRRRPRPRRKHVPNELLVKLKPGADIDALAKLLGAKVIGRDDKLGIYRLQFADAAATDAALGPVEKQYRRAGRGLQLLFRSAAHAATIANAPLPSARFR